MTRSIYCGTCRKEKEPGRDNESRCKACKSLANKEKRARKRVENGLEPYGSGRSIYCCICKSVKENRKEGYCNTCRRERDNKNRIEKGITKKHHTGKCPCGAERASYSRAYCVDCLAKRAKGRTYTEEQNKRRRERNRARYVSRRGPKKERLNPELWIKPKGSKKGNRINGIQIRCGRPNCENTEDLLSNGWCKPCAAAYQRERLKYHDLAPKSGEQIIRHRVRALTRGYIKAGKLIKLPCEVCGINESVEAHHDDYDKPMEIRWLCRNHHREHHKNNP